jgi:hypothetical protein
MDDIVSLQEMRKRRGYKMTGVQIRLPSDVREKVLHLVETWRAEGKKVKETDVYRTLIINGIAALEKE